MPSIKELDIDFETGRIQELDPSEIYFSTVGSSTGEFAEFYADKEKNMAKKKTTKKPGPSKINEVKSLFKPSTTSALAITCRPYTKSEYSDFKKSYPEDPSKLEDLVRIGFHSHFEFATSGEARAVLGALAAFKSSVEEEYTLLKAEEIKKERKDAKKGK